MVDICAKNIDSAIGINTLLNIDGALASAILNSYSVAHPDLAVLLIDMQKEYTKYLSENDSKLIIPSQIEMIKYCKNVNVPIIAVECIGYGKTIDTLINELYNFSNAKLFVKTYDSALESGVLTNYLKSNGINKLLLMGINSMSCVLKTALHAKHNGFIVSTADTLIANDADWDILFSRQEVKGVYLDNHIHFYDSHKDIIRSLEKKYNTSFFKEILN